MTARNLFIGLISGTSMDGIDAVIVDAGKHCAIEHSLFRPYQAQTRKDLDRLLQSARACDLDLLGGLDYRIGEEFAQTVLALLAQAGLSAADIAAIGSHGQTAQHRPADGVSTVIPYTLQIGDPNVIAEVTGITTVADFRRRDMAAGGQGAPLVPAFHAMLLQQVSGVAAAVNIGGIANITVKTGAEVFGFDIGPGNCLMNQWTQRHFNQAYDNNGQIAGSGRVSPTLLARLLDDPYFKQAHPKSTGPEYFNLDWLQPHSAGLQLSPQDVLCTLNQLTAATIAKTVQDHAPGSHTVYLCGGGVHNRLLVDTIKDLLPEHQVHTTAAIGIDPDFVEAAAFAWLAQQTLSGNAGNIPSVTGARRPAVLGGIYKG